MSARLPGSLAARTQHAADQARNDLPVLDGCRVAGVHCRRGVEPVLMSDVRHIEVLGQLPRPGVSGVGLRARSVWTPLMGNLPMAFVTRELG